MNNTINPDSQMPFLPWMDVQSNNPIEIIGIILFFGIAAGAIYLYIRNKKNNPSSESSVFVFETNKKEDNCTYLDDNEAELEDIQSTRELPKGIRLSFQKEGYSTLYDATVINITNDCFSIFVSPPTSLEDEYNPEIGEQTSFIAEIKNQRWTFTTTFLDMTPGNIATCNYAHTFDITKSSKRNTPRLIKNIPALISVIPRSAVSSSIPVTDLTGIAQGEIPAIISDISSDGCAIQTFSPLEFSAGDLAVLSFILPDEINEHTLFSSINNVTRVTAQEGGGSILNIKFIHIDQHTHERINSLVSSNLENEIIY